MFRRQFNRTTIITVGCIGFIVGLGLARRVVFSSSSIICIILFIAVVNVKKRNLLSVALIMVAAILVGLARGHAYMQKAAEYQTLIGEPMSITAEAETDAIYGNNGQLSFDVSHVVVEPSHRKLAGKVKVEGRGIPMVYRGDLVQVSGGMSATRGSAQARFSFAKLSLVRRHKSWLDNFRRRFIAGMQSVVPEPEASFGTGLLLGQRSTIPKQINDELSVTGLTHLVAVSGYNLTIIIVAARKLFGKASKFQSTLSAATLMLIFVLLTGLSSSIVRAAMVSGLSLLAWYYGRQFKPLLLIVLTAAATTLWNPFYLWSDIGWYLSYFAFFGVLLIAPISNQVISRGKPAKLVGGLIAETISAQLMTLPIIMYIFGRVSNISLVSNVMVVPLVPVAMLLTLFAGLCGMFMPVLGGWLAWPAKVLLTYMLDVTALFSRIPHAAVEKKIDVVTMLLAYGLILLLTIILGRTLVRRNRQNMLQ
ncbi:MAG: ComEC/Rec2 family competence protein [Candidatus Saccharimonadales bacterium]